MQQQGYYRMPTIHNDTVVFVCEDDLWRVPVEGGRAIRLTTNLGEVSRPYFSPDGKHIAFTGREEGTTEVYCMSADGGPEKRLTYLGAPLQVAGWTPDSASIVFASSSAQPFQKMFMLYTISSSGSHPVQLPVGIAQNIAFAPSGKGVVIGRNTGDPARWKRYRGGTAGVLWIDRTGKGKFQRLLSLHGNLASPMWVGNRIYFLSDHEGIGNLYSCATDGSDIQRHTNSLDFYIRNATTDGRRITYHAGGNLFIYNPATDENRKIDVEFYSPQVQRSRKFAPAADYVDDYNVRPDGGAVVVIARGKPFTFANWEGDVRQLGKRQGVRYQLTNWLNDRKRFVTVSDESGEEMLEIHSTELGVDTVRIDKIDFGRALDLQVSPVDDKIVLTNHRFELVLVDLDTKRSKILDRSEFQRIGGCAWSPDGRWVAYSCAETQYTFSIKVADIRTGKKYTLTEPRFRDVAPAFDPEGRFIYFLSYREFNPVYDSMYFDLGFPRGMRPYLISLKKDTPSPFTNTRQTPESNAAKMARTKAAITTASTQKTAATPRPVRIDFDGITERIAAFPLPEGRYLQIVGARGKVLFTTEPIRGSLDTTSTAQPSADATLEVYDFEDKKRETIATGVTDFKLSRNSETLMYRSGTRLRVIPLGGSDRDRNGDAKPGKASGWLDLDRIRMEIVPVEEWRQMYREIWRLQREHFWTENMSGINWERIYKLYQPVLEKVATRSEFSDLIWEVQAELGTSHAYEYGGDYRKQPIYRQGFLGADFSFDKKSGGYRVERIVRGDPWNENAGSPLARLGSNVKVGDILIAVDGQRLSYDRTPQEFLVNRAGTEISLSFAEPRKSTNKTVVVKTLSGETAARYREWVERNREKTLELSAGKVGYVHVPNMGPLGFAEFHRYYMTEIEREALIVDVRFNGGGHVSQLLLEKLARKRIGYDIKRWGKPEPYPSDSVLGPIVALTNEYAGSDGDIFSHSFKLMRLGKLVGKRTWGGVIGIWPRHFLVDRSVTTQPEFSFWFSDVGWQVENYGTDPDIDVEITPQDWAKGYDRQLETAVKTALSELKATPAVIPDFGPRPVLALPEELYGSGEERP